MPYCSIFIYDEQLESSIVPGMSGKMAIISSFHLRKITFVMGFPPADVSVAVEIVGSSSGRMNNIPTEYVTYASDSGPIDPPEPGDTIKPLPSWNGLRAAPEYTGHMLWKPISESNGKLVVLLGFEHNVTTKRVALRTDWLGQEFETSIYTGQYHDEPRWVHRFRETGAAYPKPVYLCLTMTNSDALIYEIPSGQNRYDKVIVPYYFPAGGNVPDPDPNPDPDPDHLP